MSLVLRRVAPNTSINLSVITHDYIIYLSEMLLAFRNKLSIEEFCSVSGIVHVLFISEGLFCCILMSYFMQNFSVELFFIDAEMLCI